jgi:peptidyl-dipeptidase Dcp
MSRIARLRVEKANLLGHKTWANYQHDVAMAKNPENVYKLLNQLWPAALSVAKTERAELQAMLESEHPEEKLQAWDWRYYAEKVKKAKYDLDEEELRPYLNLVNVQNGAFEVCRRLYGITFKEVKNVPVYHSEVKAFEVQDAKGELIGLLYMDYHPRPGKRGGAWMSNYRDQWKDGKNNIRPIVVNVGNYSRPAGDMPALMTMDEAETLFHELGHGLHGLLSQCTYRPTSGTNVPIDFVELPSQIMEHWAFEPEVLKFYARHWKTGEVMPQQLIDKIVEADKFNQGFATTEYLAAALLDMDWHMLTEAKEVDTAAFEKKSLEKMGLIPEILSRYRSTYFLHSASDYSAGYYSYIWSEVLDCDAFQAFKEKGNIFDPGTAKSFRSNILEAGHSRPAMEMYKSFRGAEPKVDALLEKRGLK